jgi:hypothetical protein
VEKLEWELDYNSVEAIAVIKAAIKWWRMHKPVGDSHKQHLANPKINVSGHHGDALAVAVAEYLKSQED